VLGQCRVYWDGVVCTGAVYCVLGQCTVYWGSVLCTGAVYCVLGQCTVYWDGVVCTGAVYCVLFHIDYSDVVCRWFVISSVQLTVQLTFAFQR